jgi:transcriptional regulator with XRE-family HTH domain
VITQGKRIKLLRVLVDMDRKQLAEALGINRSTVSNWEQDLTFPTRPVRERLDRFYEQRGIVVLPSGMPVFRDDILPTYRIEQKIPLPIQPEIGYA